ncbi:MAG: hypothetical protein ABMB14_20775 [Myxococcota bacterium]
MRTSTVVVGLVMGAILAGTLVPPLIVALPARYVDSWVYVSSEVSLLGLVAALIVACLSGFAAASFEPDDAVRTGTISGLLSAVVAGVAVVLPAVEVEACGGLLSLVLYQTTSAEELRAATAHTLVTATWAPAVTGLGLLAVGPALGAVGGVVFDLWRGSVSRTTPTIRRSWTPILGLFVVTIAVGLSTAWGAHVDLAVLPRLGHPTTWPERNGLSAPLVSAAAVTCVLAAWAIRDAVLVFRDGRRLSGLLWAMMTLSLPTLAFGLGVALYPRSLTTVGPWLAIASLGITVLVAWIAGLRSESTFEPIPRTAGDLLGEALLVGLITVGTLLYAAGASIVGSYVIAFPYVRALLSGAELVEAPPAQLVITVFSIHWGAIVAMAVVAGLYLTLAGPLWLVGRIARR